MLSDANGDGFTDVLKLTDQTEQSCNVDTYLNTTGSFVMASTRSWQRRPWEDSHSSPNNTGRKEGCNLAYQIDRRTTDPIDPDSPCQSMSSNYNASHLIDLDGDAIPELVHALESKPGSYFRPNDMDMEPDPSCQASEAACLSGDDPPQRVPCSIPPPTPWMFPTGDNDPAPGDPGSCGCPADMCPSSGCLLESGDCTSCGWCDGAFCQVTSSLSGDPYSSRAEVSEGGTDVWQPTHQYCVVLPEMVV